MTRLLGTAANRLLSAESEGELCRAGAELVSALVGSQAYVFSLSGGDRLVTRATTAGSPAGGDRSIPLTDSVLSQTATLERPVRIDDCADTRSAATTADDSTAKTYCSALLVPIPDWGLVAAADQAPGVFDDDDLKAVELVAHLVEAGLCDLGSSTGSGIAEDRLEKIASVLSHDLGSPMTVARAYVTDAIETGEMENLENVLLALDRIEEITGGLEEFARTGRTVTEPQLVELHEAAEVGWSIIETEDASLRTVSSEVILADEHRLYQLFENLFANAVQHGGEAVTVRVGMLSDEPGFFVEDDGPGIPPAQRSDVFEHGYSGTRDGSGFGLGIVRGIVEGHGWEISVVDGADGGARFEITGVQIE